MISKTQIAGVFVVLGMVLLAACAPQVAPAPAPVAPGPAPAPASPAVPAAPARPAWQAQWEAAQNAAKQEGSRVYIHTAGSAGQRTGLMQIAKMQDIDAEVVVTRAAEFTAKMNAERRAGLYLNDVYIGGLNTIMNELKPAGVFEPLDPFLILPDLTDPATIKKVWWQGVVPWVDKEHMVLRLGLHVQTPVAVNSNLVKPGDIQSYRDLLDPKWKGKLIVADPTLSGAGQQGFQGTLELMGEDFVRQLAATKPIVSRDQRQQLEWVAQGKYSILLGPQPESLGDFVSVGAPITVVVPKEGTWLATGVSNTEIIKNAPHPNTAKVFINWLSTKDAQDIFAVSSFIQSSRVDTVTSHLAPERVRKDGVNYANLATEEAATRRNLAATTLAKELYLPLIAK